MVEYKVHIVYYDMQIAHEIFGPYAYMKDALLKAYNELGYDVACIHIIQIIDNNEEIVVTLTGGR